MSRIKYISVNNTKKSKKPFSFGSTFSKLLGRSKKYFSDFCHFSP